MQNKNRSDGSNVDDVNEAGEESFPASDPAAYATPQPENQNAARKSDTVLNSETVRESEPVERSNRITAGTWVMVAIAVLLFIALISMAF